MAYALIWGTKKASGFPEACFFAKLQLHHVNGSALAGVLGILLDVEGYLLALVQGLETGALNGGEMYEYIAVAVILGDETKAFFGVEPFYRTAAAFLVFSRRFRGDSRSFASV